MERALEHRDEAERVAAMRFPKDQATEAWPPSSSLKPEGVHELYQRSAKTERVNASGSLPVRGKKRAVGSRRGGTDSLQVSKELVGRSLKNI